MAELHFVDSHAHILGQEYDRDRDEMIARAIEKHVDRIMIIALSYEEAEKAAKARYNTYKRLAGK